MSMPYGRFVSIGLDLVGAAEEQVAGAGRVSASRVVTPTAVWARPFHNARSASSAAFQASSSTSWAWNGMPVSSSRWASARVCSGDRRTPSGVLRSPRSWHLDTGMASCPDSSHSIRSRRILMSRSQGGRIKSACCSEASESLGVFIERGPFGGTNPERSEQLGAVRRVGRCRGHQSGDSVFLVSTQSGDLVDDIRVVRSFTGHGAPPHGMPTAVAPQGNRVSAELDSPTVIVAPFTGLNQGNGLPPGPGRRNRNRCGLNASCARDGTRAVGPRTVPAGRGGFHSRRDGWPVRSMGGCARARIWPAIEVRRAMPANRPGHRSAARTWPSTSSVRSGESARPPAGATTLPTPCLACRPTSSTPEHAWSRGGGSSWCPLGHRSGSHLSGGFAGSGARHRETASTP